MRKFSLALAAAAMLAPALTVSTPAEAQRRGYYDRNGNYHGPTWRGRDGRYRCTRSDGTTGTIVGGVAGAVAGQAIAGGTTGPIVGGIVGALAGRQIDRSDSGYRDRNGRRCR